MTPALALLVAAASAAAVAVPVDIQETVVRYRVPGNDLAGLRAALRDQALAEGAGGSHGRTRTSIRVAFEPEPVAGGCRAKSPAIEVAITTTLPEWEPEGAVDPEARAQWQRVAAALQRHEARHREHALAAVRDLQAALASLGVQPDCAAVQREADRALLRVRLKAEFRDARYDARTRNGRDEGATL